MNTNNAYQGTQLVSTLIHISTATTVQPTASRNQYTRVFSDSIFCLWCCTCQTLWLSG